MSKMQIYILSDKNIKEAKKLPVIKQIFFRKEIGFEQFDYLIFSSKNGVRAVENISKEWKEIPTLAIGNATKDEIEKLGGKAVFTAKKFYGDDFAKEIVQNFDKNKKFLYIRGKKVVSNLADILRENGFNLKEEIVYETVCNECEKNKKPEKNSFIIFSSPSTIECFFKQFSWDKSYKAIAIGKKTASFIPENIDCIISPVQTLKGTVEFIKTIFKQI